MTGYVRVDTSNNISDGNVIAAADLDNEFDGVQAAFNASTGHTHGGGVGEGAPITKIGPTQDVTASASLLAPKTTNTVDLGSSSLKYKDLWLAGNANFAGTTTLGGALTYGGVTLNNAVTGTGNMVLSSSPTLVTPTLGTPASVTLTNATGLPVSTGISGLGTGVAGALATNVGSTGAPVLFNGALGIPSSGTVTNLTGTASININGTVGATTASTGAFTTLTTSSTVTLNGGTANGVAYLNGSKVLTTGSALTFDGTNFATTGSVTSVGASNSGNLTFTGTGNRITGDFSNATHANRVLFQTSTANGDTNLGVIPNGASTTTRIALNNSTDPNNTSLLNLVINSSAAVINSAALGTGTLLPMTFLAGGSERVRIDTSGNVGIGTSSPAERLHVQGGDIRIQQTLPELKLVSEGAVNRWYIGANISDSVNGGLQFGSGDGISSGTTRMIIDSSGNVGIGTSSPIAIANQTSVTVSGTNAGRFDIRMGGVHTAQFLSTSTFADVGTLTSIPLTFTTNNAERARIDSSGNLLVGTTSTNNFFGTTEGVQLASNFVGSSRSGNPCVYLNRYTSTGDTMRFSYAGTQVGTVSVTASATTYNTSSDYRLKNITGPITTSGAYIDSLNPVEGTWKADGSTFVGLIAHEVQEASRTTVATGTKDGEQMQGMDYSSAEIIANLIAEVKSLRQRLAAAGI